MKGLKREYSLISVHVHSLTLFGNWEAIMLGILQGPVIHSRNPSLRHCSELPNADVTTNQLIDRATNRQYYQEDNDKGAWFSSWYVKFRYKHCYRFTFESFNVNRRKILPDSA